MRTLFLGWVQAQRGDLEQGIETMRRGLAEWSQQLVVMRPYWKGLPGGGAGARRARGGGAASAGGGAGAGGAHGERFNEAELWRLKGELLLQRGGGPEDVEACFRQAIDVARGQEARSWELRATTSLARLLRGQGRIAEAREMLAAIYGWFTEGFDTPDLIEARDLLEALKVS